MYSLIQTAIIDGIHGVLVSVEIDISTGMPMFDMVGHLSTQVREAKERVRTALHNCGIVLPAKRITLNMYPAEIHKTGTGFDLPIAVALLRSMNAVGKELCEGTVFIGELGLNGQLLSVEGILPMVLDCARKGIRRFVIPFANCKEAQLVKDVEIYAFDTLQEVIDYLRGKSYLKRNINIEETPSKNSNMDFSDVCGQLFLKRACEISAAGMHNMLMVGPPGAGKTMLAERMSTIMPNLTETEKMETSKIYSICGLLTNKNALLQERPFRQPHHTATGVAIVGGGTNPKPGEISLAHNGILFLDELTEFSKDTLEVLRQPLDSHQIIITRANNSVVFPANFLLVAAMNPCNCGYYPNKNKCRCTPAMLQRHVGRISQPFLERIDLCAQAEEISYEDLSQHHCKEKSEQIRQRVIFCHEIQKKRFENEAFFYNSQIPTQLISRYCALDEAEKMYLQEMFEKKNLSGRTCHKTLRVARTIADLAGTESIQLSHLKEAVRYRCFDGSYYGGAL